METTTFTKDNNGNIFQVVTTPVVAQDVSNQLADLKQQIVFFQKNLDAANQDVANYTSDIAEAQAQIDALTTQVSTIPELQAVITPPTPIQPIQPIQPEPITPITPITPIVNSTTTVS